MSSPKAPAATTTKTTNNIEVSRETGLSNEALKVPHIEPARLVLTKQSIETRSTAPHTRQVKRDYPDHASTDVRPDDVDAAVGDTPQRRAAKKQSVKDNTTADTKDQESAVDRPNAEIDLKHVDDPQYASKLAPEIYSFLRCLERLVLQGDECPIRPAKPIPHLKEKRTKCINRLYRINTCFEAEKDLQVPTDTIQLAIYYIDRVLERYQNENDLSFDVVAATAIYLASKFEDARPIDLRVLMAYRLFGERVYKSDILDMELQFLEIIRILKGPTANAFVLRYLQAVDMETNVSVVHTARYLCALGTSSYELSGHYYSKIAAAAAFIAYNKYSFASATSGSTETSGATWIDYPEQLEAESQYSARNIAPVVAKLVTIAEEVEAKSTSSDPERLKEQQPVEIFNYYKQKACVTATCIFPNFSRFVATAIAEETASNSDRATTCEERGESATTAVARDEESTDEAESHN